jgi:hypothetical protein
MPTLSIAILHVEVLHSFQSQIRSKEKSSVDTLDIVFQRKIHGAFETHHHYIFPSKDQEQRFWLFNNQKIQNHPP